MRRHAGSRSSARTTEKARRPGREKGNGPVIKKQRIVEPAKLVKTTYLETLDDVDGFLDARAA